MSALLSDLHRTAFVTGASTGLGCAFAEMLLADGVRVWGTSRDAARLQPLAAQFPGRFTPVTLELRNANDAVAQFRAADEAAGGIDVLINNAGYGAFGDFGDVEFSSWREQLEVMLLNTAALAHAAVRCLRARDRGAIVNISSLAAEFPLPYQTAYNMSKAGLTALSESLMIELAGTQVVVLDVRPGDYRTDFESSVRQLGPTGSPRQQKAWTEFGRMMQSGPVPRKAADDLRRALLRNRSGTVRTGRTFQATIAPFLARFGSLALKRRIQERYFGL